MELRTACFETDCVGVSDVIADHTERFALVADSGHATPFDQTEAFNQLVLAFLAEQSVPAPDG